jgi:benzoylformate decarboxylase
LPISFAAEAKIVHVDLNAYEIGKNHPVTVGIVADPKLTLAAMAGVIEAISSEADANAARERVAAARTEPRPLPHGQNSVLAAFLRELSAFTPDDVIVFDEGLTASPLIAQFLPPRLPGHNFITRGGSLGVGFPGAIGLKVANPDQTVIGFAGDGGSMYTIQSMWTAARYKIGAKFVVCDNHKYELLNDNIDQYWKERDITGHPHPRSFDLAYPEIDFVGLAGSLGVPGYRLEKAEDAANAVSRMLNHDGPFLVDVVTDDLLP